MKIAVKIGAAWCGPCKVLEHKLDSLGDVLDTFELRTVDIDTLEGKEMQGKYNIRSIPTLVVIDKISGTLYDTLLPKANGHSIKELKEFFTKNFET
jgi:thiol-disulfide isomerase/thioredoxin